MEIVVCQGKRWFARLIMRVIGYPWSHVAMRYSPPEERWIVHSTVGGVQPDWWNQFRPKYANMKRFRVKFSCADQALDAVLPEIAHKGYDHMGIIGFFLVLQLRRLGFKIKKNPLGSGNKFMCTEVIVRWLRKCDDLDPALMLVDGFTEELTDPADILKFLEASEWFEEIV